MRNWTWTAWRRLAGPLMWLWLALLGPVSYTVSFALRMGAPDGKSLPLLQQILPAVSVIRLASFLALGVHRSMWRYAGTRDLVRGGAAVGAGSAGIAAWLLAAGLSSAALWSVLAIDLLASLVLVWTGRASSRVLRDGAHMLRSRAAKRLLVIGAGDAGEMAVRELQRSPSRPYRVVAFVDDDTRKHGMSIHGVTVRGTLDELAEVATRVRADAILVAVCNASEEQLTGILERARAVGLPVKRIPNLRDIITGKAPIHQLRDVAPGELLRRRSVRVDLASVRAQLSGKVVLVTGAAGSIGSELCRQIQACEPRRLLMLDRNENALFELEQELRLRKLHVECVPVLGSVQHAAKLTQLFRLHRPQVVFHAAAYKHVPVLEYFPEEAIRNNVLGTKLTAELARRFGAESFVFISTDKAVRPTSVMGASKRIAELVVDDIARGSITRFSTIRFGNVLGSNGSVVQIFRRQIARGGPVTVTHPEIRRFFMSIPEAVELVLFAGSMHEAQRSTYILEMGEQVRVADLAAHLIRLCGLQPGVDIAIEYTGLRPGEKLYEELWTDDECPLPTGHPGILRAAREFHSPRDLARRIDALVGRAEALDRRAVVELIRELVPQYVGNPVALKQAVDPPSERPEADERVEELAGTHG